MELHSCMLSIYSYLMRITQPEKAGNLIYSYIFGNVIDASISLIKVLPFTKTNNFSWNTYSYSCSYSISYQLYFIEPCQFYFSSSTFVLAWFNAQIQSPPKHPHALLFYKNALYFFKVVICTKR